MIIAYDRGECHSIGRAPLLRDFTRLCKSMHFLLYLYSEIAFNWRVVDVLEHTTTAERSNLAALVRIRNN